MLKTCCWVGCYRIVNTYIVDFDTLRNCRKCLPVSVLAGMGKSGKKAVVSLLHEDVDRILFTEEQLATRVRELGAQITADYEGESLVVIGILRGAVPFMGDLVRRIDLPLEMDFMTVSSYGDEAQSSGRIRIVQDVSLDIRGKNVLIAEDVLDTGLTLDHLIRRFEAIGPKSVAVAALMRKDTPGQADVNCRYIGYECPNEFIVGYGLDYAQRYRNLPYIGVLKPEIYA